MTFYSFARSLCNSIFNPIYRFDVIGRENFPKEGGVLLVSNHINNLDPIAMGIGSPRPVHYMAKAELFKIPVIGKLASMVHAFPVKRGLSDREALRKGLSILKEGNVLGLFPEGTRSKTGEIGKGLAGAGFFALRTEALVLPCAIIGPYKPFKKLKIVFGKPIDLTEARLTKKSAEDITNLFMDEISNLINAHK